MQSTYVDFTVAVGPRGADGYPVTARGAGRDGRGTLVIPGDAEFLGLLTRLSELTLDGAGVTLLGQRLFAALFHGELRDAYLSSKVALGPEQGMRLRLDIDPREAEVAALPWELLQDPDDIAPLVLLDRPIVRYLPQPAPVPKLVAPLPLKVLLSAAQTSPPIGVERELQAVQDALRGVAGIAVTVEPHLTAQKLRGFLRDGFHVWHFVGHGGFAKDGATGVLLFEDAAGDAVSVSAPELNVMLNRSGVRVVVLDACGTGRLATDPFRAVAPALIRAEVPAVVAMQLDVSAEAARAFAGEFYRVIGEGLPIDACVTEGRKAVMSAAGLGRPDWGIPVIYTRAPDGVLFTKTAAPPPPARSAPPDPPPAQPTAAADPSSPLAALVALASQTAASVKLPELRRAMAAAFNLEEVTLLCSDLGVDVENLGGGTKEIIILNLIEYMRRRGRLQELLEALKGR